MTEAVQITLISVVGALCTGILVELIRTRRKAEVSVAELQPNHGTSMRDAVDRIEKQVAELGTEVSAVRTEQRTQGERLIVVETRMTDHLAGGQA